MDDISDECLIKLRDALNFALEHVFWRSSAEYDKVAAKIREIDAEMLRRDQEGPPWTTSLGDDGPPWD